MSERKVLNKYYPPDFDPSKIPKLRLPRNRQYSIRIMSPFNMRCNTCGEYIYKGKKFNSRKETVEDEEYLGLKIFRFYIKCPRCVAEIAFKTDPQNTDYALEGGATRNFEAMRTAEMLARQEIEAKEAEEANNPMKVLENRTKQSQQEMEMIETLEELRELNTRHAKVDHDSIVQLYRTYEEQLSKLQDEEDEKFVQNIFGKGANNESVKRLQDDDEESASLDAPPIKKTALSDKASDILTQDSSNGDKPTPTLTNWGQPTSSTSFKKSIMAGLVKRKTPTPATNTGLTPGGVGGTNSTLAPVTSTVAGSIPVSRNVKDTVNGSGTNNVNNSKTMSETSTTTATGVNKTSSGLTLASGLGLLGTYSDSDSNSDDS